MRSRTGGRSPGSTAVAAGGPVRLVLANDDGGIRIETVECVAGAVPSVVDLVPAANWDEREAHDLYGVRFEGHEPLRPLVEHDLDVARWTVPIQGRDPYQVAVGPIHAGVIESGHFRFHLVGEKILHLDARLFYKHRGLERAAEGSSIADGLRYVARACAACAVTNGVAYALAVEEATGLRPSAELARVRTILLELERVWSHLNDISAVCAGTGLAAGAQRFAGLTELARRLNERLTGHRFLFGAVRVGSSDLVLDSGGNRARAGGARRTARRCGIGLARARLQSILRRPAARRRRRAREGGASARCDRPSGPSLRNGCRRESRQPEARVRGLRSGRAEPDGRRRQVPARATTSRARPVLRPSRGTPRRPDRGVLAPNAARPSGTSQRHAWRARAERRSASSSAPATGSRASICGRARTPTGRSSRSPRSGTCFRTSPSSTRASSSATPAPTADADASQRSPTPSQRDRPAETGSRPQPRRSARRLRLVQRVRARADPRLEPVHGSAAVRDRDRRITPSCGRSPGDRPGDDTDAHTLAHRVRSDAGAAPRRRAGRLRDRVRRPWFARGHRRPGGGRAPGRAPDPRLPTFAGCDRRSASRAPRLALLTGVSGRARGRCVGNASDTEGASFSASSGCSDPQAGAGSKRSFSGRGGIRVG